MTACHLFLLAIRWRLLGAGVAALAAATVFALALAVGAPAAGPGAKLGIWAAPEPEIVYLPRREAQQLLAQQQALDLVYSPEGQTDMWIRIAEAIDKDAVNNPALPPVSDAIKDEAAKAQSGTHSQKPALHSEYDEALTYENSFQSKTWSAKCRRITTMARPLGLTDFQLASKLSSWAGGGSPSSRWSNDEAIPSVEHVIAFSCAE